MAGGSYSDDVSADVACQLCMLTSQLCYDDVIVIRVSHVGQVGSAHWAKKMRGARLRAWTATSPEHVSACGYVRRLILTPFSLVASSLPPLHNGMVKT